MTDIVERLRNPFSVTAQDSAEAANEIERLNVVIDRMIVAASKWDTLYEDKTGKFHSSGIGEIIANDLREIAYGGEGE